MSRHEVRRLRREMRRMETRQSREMRALRLEVVRAIMVTVPEPTEKVTNYLRIANVQPRATTDA